MNFTAIKDPLKPFESGISIIALWIIQYLEWLGFLFRRIIARRMHIIWTCHTTDVTIHTANKNIENLLLASFLVEHLKVEPSWVANYNLLQMWNVIAIPDSFKQVIE